MATGCLALGEDSPREPVVVVIIILVATATLADPIVPIKARLSPRALLSETTSCVSQCPHRLPPDPRSTSAAGRRPEMDVVQMWESPYHGCAWRRVIRAR